MNYRGYCIILTAFFCCTYVYGQRNSQDELLKSYDRQFSLLDSLLNVPYQKDNWESLFQEENFPFGHLNASGESDRMDGVSGSYASLEKARNRKTEAEVSAIKMETGLQLTGNYAHRKTSGGTSSSTDEEGEHARLSNRFQSELSWNILQSGLVQAKNKVAAYKIGSKLTGLENRTVVFSNYINGLKIGNERLYRQGIESIYALRLKHLHLLEQTEQILLEHHQSSSDRLMEIMNEIFELEQKMLSDTSSVSPVKGLAYFRTDTLCIHTDRLLAAVNTGNDELVKLDLNRELLGIKVKQASFLMAMNVSPYLKYSTYDVVDGKNHSNVDIGMSVRVPLSLEAAKSRKALRLEQKVCEMKRELTFQTLTDEVIHCIREIHLLNSRLCQEYRRLSRIRRLLDERSEAYCRLDGTYSRPARIKEYTLYLSCLEEVIRLKYEQNNVLIGLQSYLSDTPVGSLMEFVMWSEV